MEEFKVENEGENKVAIEEEKDGSNQGLSVLNYLEEDKQEKNLVKARYSFFSWKKSLNKWEIILDTGLGLPLAKLDAWDGQYIIAEKFTEFIEKERKAHKESTGNEGAAIAIVYHPYRLFISSPRGFGTIANFLSIPPQIDYLTEEERRRHK